MAKYCKLVHTLVHTRAHTHTHTHTITQTTCVCVYIYMCVCMYTMVRTYCVLSCSLGYAYQISYTTCIVCCGR